MNTIIHTKQEAINPKTKACQNTSIFLLVNAPAKHKTEINVADFIPGWVLSLLK